MTWMTDAPELAATVRARFEATGLAFLATLRRGGAPRVSGIEPLFWRDTVWLGSMPGARKAADLQRDPRFALHAASVDREMRDGDAKLAGTATEVLDPGVIDAFLAAFAEANGYGPPPGPMHLFRCDVTEAVHTRLAGDHLVIESWHADGGLRRTERA